MSHALDGQSLKILDDVHPDLRRLVLRASEISQMPFMLTEGRRSRERQSALVKSGASRTMNSRHLTGHAIDFAPTPDGELTWSWPPFHLVAAAFKQAARELHIDMRWGGDWQNFKDGPHIELSRKAYP